MKVDVLVLTHLEMSQCGLSHLSFIATSKDQHVSLH